MSAAAQSPQTRAPLPSSQSRSAALKPPRPPRTPLAVVPTPRARHGRSAFVALISVVLALGLVGLLAMNTVLAQEAFAEHTLAQQRADLAVTEQALAADVAAQEDPSRLASRAWSLGLRPGGTPVFLQLPGGTIVGGSAKTGSRR